MVQKIRAKAGAAAAVAHVRALVSAAWLWSFHAPSSSRHPSFGGWSLARLNAAYEGQGRRDSALQRSELWCKRSEPRRERPQPWRTCELWCLPPGSGLSTLPQAHATPRLVGWSLARLNAAYEGQGRRDSALQRSERWCKRSEPRRERPQPWRTCELWCLPPGSGLSTLPQAHATPRLVGGHLLDSTRHTKGKGGVTARCRDQSCGAKDQSQGGSGRSRGARASSGVCRLALVFPRSLKLTPPSFGGWSPARLNAAYEGQGRRDSALQRSELVVQKIRAKAGAAAAVAHVRALVSAAWLWSFHAPSSSRHPSFGGWSLARLNAAYEGQGRRDSALQRSELWCKRSEPRRERPQPWRTCELWCLRLALVFPRSLKLTPPLVWWVVTCSTQRGIRRARAA